MAPPLPFPQPVASCIFSNIQAPWLQQPVRQAYPATAPSMCTVFTCGRPASPPRANRQIACAIASSGPSSPSHMAQLWCWSFTGALMFSNKFYIHGSQ
uniref:Uncharacterized protein n=1 Tax=Triticum urartu TaxID=4572 RepID=A0A8R7QHM6_TRIUA